MPEQTERFQHNLMNHLSCGTGAPLVAGRGARGHAAAPGDIFARDLRPCAGNWSPALAALLNRGIVPVVPRYGSVGASGDLMPSAYIARALLGMGQVDYQGRRMPAGEALRAAGLETMHFAPKEGLALINGTTGMTAFAALVWVDAWRVLRALLGAVALAIEALEAPSEPYQPWVHESKGHPGQIAVAAYVARFARRQRLCHRILHSTLLLAALRAARSRPGLGGAGCARAPSSSAKINSANDNPLIDPETGTLYRAGNFYGGHISRLLDTLKMDFAIEANWANALFAVLVDDKFNGGLPANLVPDPGMNSGFKGMQLSITSLTCAIRQMAGPSSIHSLPTEQYNQDVVSLGMHSAVTAADALECLRNAIAMVLLAAAQAVDLRGGPAQAGAGKPPRLRCRAPRRGVSRSRPADGGRHPRARARDPIRKRLLRLIVGRFVGWTLSAKGAFPAAASQAALFKKSGATGPAQAGGPPHDFLDAFHFRGTYFVTVNWAAALSAVPTVTTTGCKPGGALAGTV